MGFKLKEQRIGLSKKTRNKEKAPEVSGAPIIMSFDTLSNLTQDHLPTILLH